MERNIFGVSEYVFADYYWLSLNSRILYALYTIKPVYYPVLAVVAVPVNVLTIVVLSRGKCGLSSSVTRYLVSMAAADLLVVVFDVVLIQIPIAYWQYFSFLHAVPVCNIHAVLLYAATDCSVWFTVAFTFDRFVHICSQKLRSKYCTKRTAIVAIGTVMVLSCLNMFWYFMFRGEYHLGYYPWFSLERPGILQSPVWVAIEFLHNLFISAFPFCLILLLNTLTTRHVLVTSRARRRLRTSNRGENLRDTEMESRRKSLVVLIAISANFILLWEIYMLYNIWGRMYYLGYQASFPPSFLQELGFMLQLLSCCTNTALYAVTQRKFREQLKEAVKYPVALLAKAIPW